MSLSVVLITHNEELNLGRALESVQVLVRDGLGEAIVIDSGSTDRTVEIAKSSGAKVFIEGWKGYAGQKNSAIDKAAGEWILSLDADEELSPGAVEAIRRITGPESPGLSEIAGYWLVRKNYFLGKWMRHGGFYPDRKLRLFRKGTGRVRERTVHETIEAEGKSSMLESEFRLAEPIAIIHHSYPTLSDYIDHMNHYSSLGAEMAVSQGRAGFSVVNIVIRPGLTFFYNYLMRLGFLDGREGLLLHLYHAVYVSWKYAKAWESGRCPKV